MAASSSFASKTPTRSARHREMVEGILDGMRWLGSIGTRVRSSAGRTARISSRSGSTAIARRRSGSLPAGHAYYCYCTPDEMKAKREAAERQAARWRYDRTCANLTPAEIALRERTGNAARRPIPRARPGSTRVRRSGARPDRVRRRQPRRLRHPAFRRPSHLPPLGRVRRCAR